MEIIARGPHIGCFMETKVEYGNLKENRAGKYIVKGCVRDQYGHRYYMKTGEKRR